MKETRCQIELEVNADCPHCGMEIDIRSELEVDIFMLKQNDVDLNEVFVCEYCNEEFLVREIDF